MRSFSPLRAQVALENAGPWIGLLWEPSFSGTPVIGQFLGPLDSALNGVVGGVNEFLAFKQALPVALDFFASSGWALLVSFPLHLRLPNTSVWAHDAGLPRTASGSPARRGRRATSPVCTRKADGWKARTMRGLALAVALGGAS